jgi:hypothetical protein
MTRGAGGLRKGYISGGIRGEADMMGEMNHYAAFVCSNTTFLHLAANVVFKYICYKIFSPCKLKVDESYGPECQYTSDNTVCVEVH